MGVLGKIIRLQSTMSTEIVGNFAVKMLMLRLKLAKSVYCWQQQPTIHDLSNSKNTIKIMLKIVTQNEKNTVITRKDNEIGDYNINRIWNEDLKSRI